MIKGTSGLETHSKVNKSLFIKVSTNVKYFRCMSRFSMAFFCLIIFLFFVVYGFVCLFVFFFSLFIFNLFSLLPFYFKLFLSLFFKSNFYTLFPRISAQALI